MSFFEFLMRIGQNVNSNIFPNLKHKTAVCWKGVRAVADFQFLLRERERDFSLDFRAIRPSKFFGARRKVVLRNEGNAWASILSSFDKLPEVGVSSYLFYTLFKCFVMFELV